MGRSPDFIGLGAQRAGTSWIYTCLYEHPEVCIPIKEIHFFSRQRNWPKGYEWYESIFGKCPPSTKAGEFSTSYLVDPATPERIHARYPKVRLIVSLRNPADRAYSNYMNDIMSGKVKPSTPFLKAMEEHPEYIEQGRYVSQLRRYLEYFSREQILILLFEDIQRDPLNFIQHIYRFIGVSNSFLPSLLTTKVNVGRVPRFLWIDNLLMKVSQFLHKGELHRVWWLAKKARLGDRIRAFNTRRLPPVKQGLDPSERRIIYETLKDEIVALEELLGRELREWHI